MTETEQRLKHLSQMAGVPWFIAIEESAVNLDDLLHSMRTSGGIVRVDGNPHDVIRFCTPPTQDEAFASVASWISEDV